MSNTELKEILSNKEKSEKKEGAVKYNSLEDASISKSSLAPLSALFFSLLIADQFTKYLATSKLQLGEIVKVIDGVFNFTLVFNPGAAFGMFAGLPDFERRAVLLVVSLLALGVVFYMLKETKNDKFSQFALISILSGAVGNFIDRFRYDAVVDFLDFYIQDYHWPAFNIADSAISVGVFILMFRLIFFQEENS